MWDVTYTTKGTPAATQAGLHALIPRGFAQLLIGVSLSRADTMALRVSEH